MLQQLLAGCPHAVVRDNCYPQLLKELLRHAAPLSGTRRSPDTTGRRGDDVNNQHPEQTLLMQQTAMRCIASLAAHDERALQIMVDQVVPVALADSSELCWQSTLAQCSNVMHAMSSTSCRPSGEGSEGASFSMQRLITRLKSAEQCAGIEGPVMQARRLCRLALLSQKVCVA